MSEQFDTVIIGAGPAGTTAGLYLGRAGLRAMVMGDITKSGMYRAQHIQNYPGFPEGITGPALTERFLEQLSPQGVPVENREVVRIRVTGEGFETKTADGHQWPSETVLLACGRTHIPSGVLGERHWLGRGVHTSAMCDAHLYRGKKVAVIGNTNFTAEEALDVWHHTNDVTILTNNRAPSWNDRYGHRLVEHHVEIVDAPLKAFRGNGGFQGVETRRQQFLEFDAVFVGNGQASSLNFAQELGLERSEGNYVIVDRDGQTNVSGVYAAGYCTSATNQVTKSVGEGTAAAIAIIRRKRGIAHYLDHT